MKREEKTTKTIVAYIYIYIYIYQTKRHIQKILVIYFDSFQKICTEEDS